jgi:WD40 repeat protein
MFLTMLRSHRLRRLQLFFLVLACALSASWPDCSCARSSQPRLLGSVDKKSSYLDSLGSSNELPSGSCLTIPPDAAFAATMLGHDQNGVIERRVALVIGNGAYGQIVDTSTERHLLNPLHDAASVARALHALGFTVVAGVDLKKAAALTCLSGFYKTAEGAKAALFYFAGHGLSAGGNTYLLPIDAHVDTQEALGKNFLRVNGPNGILQQLRQRAPTFLFLDACRNIPFQGGGPLRKIDDDDLLASESRGLVPLRDSDGGISGLRDFYYAYATFPGETASDDVDASGHSPFAGAFLRHVAEPGLDVPRLLLRMSFDVGAATSGAQLPWGEGALKASSDLYFNGTQTLDDMIKESDQLARESDNMRTRGQRVEAIETALRGLPLGNSANLSVHFGQALASLYRAVQSKEVVTEDSPTSCASAVAFSPDRQSVLTAIRGKRGKDCETNLPDIDAPKIWDATTGRLLLKFDLSELSAGVQFRRVLDARYSQDGKTIILEVVPRPEPSKGGQPLFAVPDQPMEPQLQWWDAATGKFLRSLPPESPESMTIQAFNENTVVMSCKKEGCSNIDVYDAWNGRLRRSLKDLLEPVFRLTKHFTDMAGNPKHDNIKTSALSSDGQLFFAISEGNGLGGVWDLRTGSLKCSIDVSAAAVPDHLYFDSGTFRDLPASFDKDAHRLAFTRDNQTVRIYDVDKCKEIRAITQNARAFLSGIELSPDGRSVFTAQTNYQFRLWSVSTGELLRTFVGHTDWVRVAAYTDDSKLLATASDDGSVRIWNVDRDQAVRTIWPEPGFITEAKFSHDSSMIATVSDGLLFPDGKVPSAQLWTGVDSKPKTLANWRADKIASVEFSRDDRWILGAARSDIAPRLTLWDAKTLEPVPGMSSPDHFEAATFGPGNSLAILRDSTIELWIPNGNSVKLANVYHFPGVQAILSSSGDRRSNFRSDTKKLVFSGDGKKLAIIDGAILVLSFPQLETLHQLELPHSSFTSARFDPSGEHLLGVSRLGTGLWDVQTGRQLSNLTSLDGEQVLSADISPDGERIVTASWSDGATIRLWSVRSGEILAKQSADITAGTGYINVLNDQGVIEGLEWATWSVSFNIDGTRVISAAGDGAARIWDIGPYGHDLIEAGQTVLSRSGEKASVANRMVFWEIVPE